MDSWRWWWWGVCKKGIIEKEKWRGKKARKINCTGQQGEERRGRGATLKSKRNCETGKKSMTDKGNDGRRQKQSERESMGGRQRKRKRQGDEMFSQGSVEQVLSNKHRWAAWQAWTTRLTDSRKLSLTASFMLHDTRSATQLTKRSCLLLPDCGRERVNGNIRTYLCKAV